MPPTSVRIDALARGVSRVGGNGAAPAPGRESRSRSNRALARRLASIGAQAKLRVSGADDPAEREADLAAAQVLSAGAGVPPALLRRGGAGAAPMRRGDEDGEPPDALARNLKAMRGGGASLPKDLRTELEPRFGAEFADVRVHTDAAAAAAAAAVESHAFTAGRDIFFAAGRFAPHTRDGRQLIAHELAHVVQQRGGAVAVQRKCDACREEDEELLQRQAAPRGAAVAPLVDDDVAPAPGQMRLSAFMAVLRSSLTELCNGELRAVGRSADACPYLQGWLDYYEHQSAAAVMRAIRLYARPPAGADAQDLIELVRQRVLTAVRTWIATGRIVGVPEGVPPLPPAGGPAGGAAGPPVQGKSVPGAPGGGLPDAGTVQARLGGGRPLDAGVRSRMERAFGGSLGDVRVHDDLAAHQVSTDMSVRAFAVGRDIGFARGQYRPGTLVGDLLIAHELAHTVQQGGTHSASRPGAGAERQADSAAVAALLGRRVNLPESEYGLEFQGCPAAAGGALAVTLETAEVAAPVVIAETAAPAVIVGTAPAALAPAAPLAFEVAAPTVVAELAPAAPAVLAPAAAPTVAGGVTLSQVAQGTAVMVGGGVLFSGDTAPTQAPAPGRETPTIPEIEDDPEFSQDPPPQSTPEEDTDEDQGTECTNGPRCPHLGGSAMHNFCADHATGNLFPGCDYWVAGKNFDALAPGRILWEVKTWRYRYYPPRQKRFAEARLLLEAGIEMAIALRCGYMYLIGVTDPDLYAFGLRSGLPMQLIQCPTIH